MALLWNNFIFFPFLIELLLKYGRIIIDVYIKIFDRGKISMMKKFFSMFLVLSIIFANLCMTISYAATVPVTEENLEMALQKFVESGSDENHYKISVANNVISISSDDGDYAISYELTSNPTFSYTVDVKQGMSYEVFKKEISNLSAPMLGYMAVANTQGVANEDALTYFSLNLFTSALSGTSSLDLSDSYMIVSDDVIVEGDTEKVIKESEFGNRVMEYVKATYGEKKVLTDAESINSFEYITELKDVTDTSCKLVTTLTVNMDADFLKLEEASNAMQEAMTNMFNDIDVQPAIPELTDIAETKYEEAVGRLVGLGVINGFEDHTFRPTENVTRAQFAKMLVTALDLEFNDSATVINFPDVEETHWANEYIKIAVSNGIIQGYPEGTFMPENPVTYAEAMTMILRAMNLEETMSDKSWPLGYINEAMEVGLLELVDYNEPNVPINRGETAISLFNMIQKIEYDKRNIITYSNENGEITLEEVEPGKIDFNFSGLANGEMWSLGMPLDYADGVASAEDDFFDDIVKIKVVIESDKIIVEASSTDPESGYNGINGTYELQAN